MRADSELMPGGSTVHPGIQAVSHFFGSQDFRVARMRIHRRWMAVVLALHGLPDRGSLPGKVIGPGIGPFDESDGRNDQGHTMFSLRCHSRNIPPGGMRGRL